MRYSKLLSCLAIHLCVTPLLSSKDRGLREQIVMSLGGFKFKICRRNAFWFSLVWRWRNTELPSLKKSSTAVCFRRYLLLYAAMSALSLHRYGCEASSLAISTFVLVLFLLWTLLWLILTSVGTFDLLFTLEASLPIFAAARSEFLSVLACSNAEFDSGVAPPLIPALTSGSGLASGLELSSFILSICDGLVDVLVSLAWWRASPLLLSLLSSSRWE
mmetsp:Transcript_21047/g.29485  ORF Transcript_21047/g.29485 Transcript_21047/m.29485 type:complete len:217 (-) Transcript_21047:910-1560(-)